MFLLRVKKSFGIQIQRLNFSAKKIAFLEWLLMGEGGVSYSWVINLCLLQQ